MQAACAGPARSAHGIQPPVSTSTAFIVDTGSRRDRREVREECLYRLQPLPADSRRLTRTPILGCRSREEIGEIDDIQAIGQVGGVRLNPNLLAVRLEQNQAERRIAGATSANDSGEFRLNESLDHGAATELDP